VAETPRDEDDLSLVPGINYGRLGISESLGRIIVRVAHTATEKGENERERWCIYLWLRSRDVVRPLRKVVAENGKGGRRFRVCNGVASDEECRVVGFDGALDDDLDVFGGCVRDEAVNDDTGVR